MPNLTDFDAPPGQTSESGVAPARFPGRGEFVPNYDGLRAETPAGRQRFYSLPTPGAIGVEGLYWTVR
jgi:hypothetical protein